jgi:hypothetical protein
MKSISFFETHQNNDLSLGIYTDSVSFCVQTGETKNEPTSGDTSGSTNNNNNNDNNNNNNIDNNTNNNNNNNDDNNDNSNGTAPVDIDVDSERRSGRRQNDSEFSLLTGRMSLFDSSAHSSPTKERPSIDAVALLELESEPTHYHPY